MTLLHVAAKAYLLLFPGYIKEVNRNEQSMINMIQTALNILAPSKCDMFMLLYQANRVHRRGDRSRRSADRYVKYRRIQRFNK